MAREDEFAAIMLLDATLDTILTGGVHTSGTVGRNGITQEAVPSAFSDGELLPVALVRNRDVVPDGQVVDFLTGETSAVEVVEIWVYQEVNYDKIDAALARCKDLFQGRIMTDGFEAEWINTIDRFQDEGALAGASGARQDWAVSSIY